MLNYGTRASVSAKVDPIATAIGTQMPGRGTLEPISHPHADPNVLRSVRNRKEHFPEAVLAEDGSIACGPPRFLLSGWACRQSIMSSGHRQIFSFLIPGNIIATSSKSLSFASVVALTPGVTAQVLLSEHARPGGRPPSEYAALIEAAEQETQQLLHDHIMRLGCMSGSERMAHLVLELHRRLSDAGLSNGQSFPMPLRQGALGDALGMSTVHANRTLQKLRNNGLIEYSGIEMTIIEPNRLNDLANGAGPIIQPIGDRTRMPTTRIADGTQDMQV